MAPIRARAALARSVLRRMPRALEEAKAERDPIRRLDIERRVADYWRIARTGGENP